MPTEATPEIVTFVFSDIEHSTRLAQRLREDYPELLERHRAVIRAAITQHQGREIDTAGDGFFMTFTDPCAAVLAAADIQRAFHSQDWAKAVELKVRMGLHTGEALPTADGYTGVEVHRASRVCDAAYGGQVLLSGAAEKHLQQQLCENGLSASPLGAYTFKDFTEPIELFQLNIPGIEQSFPGPRIHPTEKRIAVLPFTTWSKDPEYEYLEYGMAEELIIALGKVKGLRVVSRSTAFSIKREELSIQEAGEILQVHALLLGRIRIVNNQLRITAELTDTDTGLNIWSEQYNRNKEELVHMQDEIIQEIVAALELSLVPEQRHSVEQRQSHNAEAYDFYLRGRRFYFQWSRRGIELALQMFSKAIEADPNYALAHAGLADCYSFQYQHTDPNKEIIDLADAASTKAVELGPSLAKAYASRGIVMSLKEEYAQAEQNFQLAIELDPTLFLGWFHYGRTCFTMGKLDKAARLFEQANRVAPDDYQSVFLAAQAYSDIDCPDLAETLRKRGVAIAETWLELNPGDTRALYLTANALVFLGQRERSLSLLQRALALEPDDSMLLYNAGCVYALLGMKTEALFCLESAYLAGLTLRGWYENDSNLDSLREEPRFIHILQQLRGEEPTP